MVVMVHYRGSFGMRKALRGLPVVSGAAFACLAVAAVTACGSSPATSAAPADPLAAMSGQQVLAKAVAGLKAAPSFSMAGAMTDSSGTYNVNLAYKQAASCKGTVAQPGKGSFAMIVIGKTAWVKPDEAFWKANAGSQAPATIALLGGRYLKGSTGNSNVASLTKLCDVSTLTTSLARATNVAKGEATTVNGQRVLPLTDKSKGGTLYVTDSASPKIAELVHVKGGNSGKLTFSYVPVTLTAPPASQSVDGSKLGF
jgi:hypothetical protein